MNVSRSVLITGATGRLGADLVGYFARSGYRVIFQYRSLEAEARAAEGHLRSDGFDVSAVFGSFDTEQETVDFVRRVENHYGCPGILINNASAFKYDFPGKMDFSLLNDSLNIHIRVPAILIELFASAGKSRGQNIDVINIIDQKTRNLNPDYFSYSIGKFGLMGLTSLWQRACVGHVRVFGLYPGLMSISGDQTEERFLLDSKKSLLQRSVTSSDVYEGMIYLLNSKSRFGTDLVIDAGESIVPRARDVAYE